MDPTASRGRVFGRHISRRAFLALTGAAGLGVLGANRAVGQSPSPSPFPFPVSSSTDAIGDLADALGLDVEQIFRFVADEIRYEPYAGILRGPTGTLASRAGNSAHQAELLAALLQAAAVPVRFAWGALDQSTAAALMGSAAATADEARQQAIDALLGPRPSATPAGSPDPGVLAQLQKPGSTPDDIGSWIGQQLDGTISTITGALIGAGIQLPTTISEMPAPERSQHIWVQVANGADWQGLDPSIPGQVSGQSLTAVQGTAGTLADDLHHTVELSVVAESISGGALAEKTLLTVTRNSDDLANAPILMVNVDPAGLKAIGVKIAAGLEGWRSYVAVLGIGDEGWTSTGVIQFATDSGIFAPSGPAPEGETTAEWLQLTIARPGRDPLVVRRPIFDRIGDAARAAGTVDLSGLSPVTLTSLGPKLPNEYTPARNTTWLTVTTGAPTAGRIAASTDPSGLMKMTALPQSYQLVRELAAASIGTGHGVRTFPDEPNIAAITFTVDPSGTAHAPSQLSLDILHRSFSQLPVSDVAATAPAALLGGVLSHVTERLLMRALAVPNGTQPPESASVGAVFDAAAAAAVPLHTIQGTLPAGVTVPPDAAARLAGWLTKGWVAILPEHPVQVNGGDRTGWWLVDPASGVAIDEMDDGRGVAIDEYGVTLAPGQAAAEALEQTKLVCFVAGAVAVGAGLFITGAGAGWIYTALTGGTGALGEVLLYAASMIAAQWGTAAGLLGEMC